MLRDLHQSIVDCDLSMLRAIARARGFELKATRQPAAVDELGAHLLDQEATDWALTRLSEESCEALEALLRAGGMMKAHIFSHRFGALPTVGPGRLEREKPWADPQTPAERLSFMGLIFTTFSEVDVGFRAEFVYVPSDVIALLPAVEVAPPRFEVTPVEVPPVVSSRRTTFVYATFVFLIRLQMNPLPTDQQDRLTASARRRLERYHPDFDEPREGGLPRESSRQLDFLHHLARAAELVHVSERRLRPNPDRAKQWLKWSRPQQLYCLQTSWHADHAWDELRHIPGLAFEETGWVNDPFTARRAVLQHLSACPPETWLSVDSLVAAIKEVDPDFARPDGDYRSWYIRDADSGDYLMDFAHWDDVEGALIVHTLVEPLNWLGVVDLGFEQEDSRHPYAFQITPYGEALLGLSDAPSTMEEPPTAFTVHTDFTIQFPPGSRLYEPFQTQRFARLEKDANGGGAVYRITRDSLKAAQAQGISTKMIVSFLHRYTRTPVPSNVREALQKWQPV